MAVKLWQHGEILQGAGATLVGVVVGRSGLAAPEVLVRSRSAHRPFGPGVRDVAMAETQT